MTTTNVLRLQHLNLVWKLYQKDICWDNRCPICFRNFSHSIAPHITVEFLQFRCNKFRSNFLCACVSWMVSWEAHFSSVSLKKIERHFSHFLNLCILRGTFLPSNLHNKLTGPDRHFPPFDSLWWPGITWALFSCVDVISWEAPTGRSTCQSSCRLWGTYGPYAWSWNPNPC